MMAGIHRDPPGGAPLDAGAPTPEQRRATDVLELISTLRFRGTTGIEAVLGIWGTYINSLHYCGSVAGRYTFAEVCVLATDAIQAPGPICFYCGNSWTVLRDRIHNIVQAFGMSVPVREGFRHRCREGLMRPEAARACMECFGPLPDDAMQPWLLPSTRAVFPHAACARCDNWAFRCDPCIWITRCLPDGLPRCEDCLHEDRPELPFHIRKCKGGICELVNTNTGEWINVLQPEYELHAISDFLFALLCCVLASLTPYRLMAEDGVVYDIEDFLSFYEGAEDNHQRFRALLRVWNPMLLLVTESGLPPRISLSPPIVALPSTLVSLRRHPGAGQFLRWIQSGGSP